MTKSYYKPNPSIVQGKLPNINHPDFNFETEFCKRINKIRGIADLFFCAGTGEQAMTSEGIFGIHYMLEDCAEELRAICYKMLANQEV
jgi:hypothetical protein